MPDSALFGVAVSACRCGWAHLKTLYKTKTHIIYICTQYSELSSKNLKNRIDFVGHVIILLLEDVKSSMLISADACSMLDSANQHC